MNGFEVAQTIRETDRRIIIFFLTDRTDKVDRLYGFKLKGNDYIPKPFYPEELIAKINERFESDITSQDIEYLLGNTLFRPNLASLTYKGETHSLSVRQTEILAILAKMSVRLLTATLFSTPCGATAVTPTPLLSTCR